MDDIPHRQLRPRGAHRRARVGLRHDRDRTRWLAQTRLALDIIAAALVECGASIGDAVMVRISLVDFADFEDVARALRERFAEVRPAMTAVQVAALIDPRHRVEIEVQAFVPAS